MDFKEQTYTLAYFETLYNNLKKLNQEMYLKYGNLFKDLFNLLIFSGMNDELMIRTFNNKKGEIDARAYKNIYVSDTGCNYCFDVYEDSVKDILDICYEMYNTNVCTEEIEELMSNFPLMSEKQAVKIHILNLLQQNIPEITADDFSVKITLQHTRYKKIDEDFLKKYLTIPKNHIRLCFLYKYKELERQEKVLSEIAELFYRKLERPLFNSQYKDLSFSDDKDIRSLTSFTFENFYSYVYEELSPFYLRYLTDITPNFFLDTFGDIIPKSNPVKTENGVNDTIALFYRDINNKIVGVQYRSNYPEVKYFYTKGFKPGVMFSKEYEEKPIFITNGFLNAKRIYECNLGNVVYLADVDDYNNIIYTLEKVIQKTYDSSDFSKAQIILAFDANIWKNKKLYKYIYKIGNLIQRYYHVNSGRYDEDIIDLLVYSYDKDIPIYEYLKDFEKYNDKDIFSFHSFNILKERSGYFEQVLYENPCDTFKGYEEYDENYVLPDFKADALPQSLDNNTEENNQDRDLGNFKIIEPLNLTKEDYEFMEEMLNNTPEDEDFDEEEFIAIHHTIPSYQERIRAVEEEAKILSEYELTDEALQIINQCIRKYHALYSADLYFAEISDYTIVKNVYEI